MFDKTEIVEIGGAWWETAKLLVLGAIMIGTCAVIALPISPSFDAGYYGKIVGWFGIMFFGACVAIALWRAISIRGPVVTLSPAGLKDVRVSDDVIPWSAIRDVGTWSSYGQKIMVLDVAPEVEAQLSLTRVARWSRSANTAYGADGLCITTAGLNIGYDELLTRTLDFLARHAPPGSSDRAEYGEPDSSI